MRHLKVLGVMLAAMFTLGVTALGMTATSALALPDVSILPGETFPLDLHFADNEKTLGTLETSQGAVLLGKGVLLLLDLNALSALGPFEVLFLKVKEDPEGPECNTPGDKKGEVLITGEWHLVPLAITPPKDGIAFLLLNLVLIECGTKQIDITGCALATITAEKEKVDLTETSGALGTDGKGKNLKREYINDSKAKVKCVLMEELVGTKIKREAAEGVEKGEPITLTIGSSSLAKMFEFTGL